MKFLVFDQEFMSTSLGWRLHLEGSDVRVFSQQKESREHLQNMVVHVNTLEQGLAWVGRDGYIICGDEQDLTPLRRRGFKVYGGNAWTARLENDRNFQHETVKQAGLPVSNAHSVKNIDEAISFIKKHPDVWALKQMGQCPKTWNYVGKNKDGSDIIDQLLWMKGSQEFKRLKGQCPFMLQEVIEGLEFGTSGWWMAGDWKRTNDGSILMEQNREFKKALDGDQGLTTGEMGTVGRFTDNTKLFEATLEKMTPVLRKMAPDVIINIDANCGIVEEDGKPYLFELTPREGYPFQSLMIHLLNQDVGKFFANLIDKKQGDVETKKDWGVVTVLGCGHFPQETVSDNHEGSFKDQPVIIPQWETAITSNIHPLYLKYDMRRKFFRVADYYEYLAAFTESGPDIIESNKRCVENMDKMECRAKFYRRDIGQKFAKEELSKLQALGYI